MSTSALESEDLENVPLVRMEDVQPSRTYEMISRRRSDEEVLETCVIENIEYDNECIVNDDDDDEEDDEDDDDDDDDEDDDDDDSNSNIGSMVSVQSEEVIEDDSDAEMIVPEMIPYDGPEVVSSVLEPLTKYQGLSVCEEPKEEKKAPSSWPTLEILPGGVIKKPENNEEEPSDNNDDCPTSLGGDKPGEMMYACAKCPQTFKFLFCLVKHVKWHEDEAKKRNGTVQKVKQKDTREYACLHSNKRKMVICVKAHKKKSAKKQKS